MPNFPVRLSFQRWIRRWRAGLSLNRSDRERAVLQEPLQDGQQRFRALVEQASDLLAVLGPDWAFRYVSPSYRVVAGGAAEALLGRSALDFVHPDDLPMVREQLTRLGGSPGAGVRFECRYRYADGSWRDLDSVCTDLLLDPAVAGIAVSSRDITERKQAEVALKRFRTLVDRAKDAIEVVDPETGQFIDVNQKACLDLGYSRKELLALRVFDVDPMVDQTEFARGVDDIRKRGTLTREGIHRRKDGSTFPVEVTITQARNFGEHLVVVARDITERKQAEKALQDKTTWLDLSVRGAGLGVWHWDFKTDVITTLVGGGPISGLPKGIYPTTGTAFYALVHPEDRGLVGERIQRAAERREEYRAEFRILLSNGTIRWVAARGQCLNEADGKALVLNGVDLDITKLKEAEMALQRQQNLYAMLSHTNQAIVHGRERNKLLAALCHIAVEHGRFLFAWIGTVDTENKRVLPVVKYGVDTGLAYALRISTDPSEATGRGPIAQALQTGRRVVSNDFLNDPATAPWHDAARRAGVRAAAALPLHQRGEVVCVIALHADEPGFFTEDILATLDEMATDISFALDNLLREAERARTEEALRESEERFRGTFEQAAVGIAHVAPDGHWLLVNQKLCDIVGYTRDELLALKFQDLTHPDDLQSNLEGIGQVLANKIKIYSMTKRYVRKNGSTVWIDLTLSLVRDAAGQPKYFIVVTEDITERRRAEQPLNDSQRRLDGIVNSAMDAILTVDDAERITFLNSAAEKMFGCEPAEAIGAPLERFVPERFRAAHHRHIQRFGRMSDTQLTVGRARGICGLRASGEEFPIEASISRTDVDAHPLFTIILRDVTEQVRSDAAHAELEARLRVAQRIEALGALAGGIAHDFNNILGAIIGNTELARQDVGPSHPALESLTEISKASHRAKELVQRILAFGRQQPQPQSVIALCPVVEEAVALLRATLPAGIELAAACEADTPTVLADPTQIHQVLMNLCTNSWHAMDGDIGRIDIRLDWVTRDAINHSPGRFARLCVTDNGSGMDPATLEHIFDPFFTTKPVGQGTGLGLSVVHSIVETLGGTVSVTSQRGTGTTFSLYFPAAPAAQPSATPPAAGTESFGSGAGQHVLYLDDEAPLVSLVTRMLKRLGYRVSGYTRPEEALAAVRADPGQFDLVVSDVNMPGIHGLEVARELAHLRPDLPVVLASGYVTDEMRAQARVAGVRQVVYKPNTVEELCAVVQRLTGDAKPA